MIKDSVYVSSHEIVIPLPVSIFFNKILYFYFQIAELPETCQKTFSCIVDQTSWQTISGDYDEEKYLKLTFFVISC